MAGEWDCEQLDVLIDRLLKADLFKYVLKNPRFIAQLVGAKVMNYGSKSRAFQVGERHYDIGNELYKAMLDKRMIYSCGYWKDAKNLDEAQEAKLDLICRKLQLKKGMRLLDIGGGWGGLAKYAAEKYGASVVTVSVSKEQVAMANESCKGLDVENRLMDYRDLDEKFDRIASVGMLEHVGAKNFRTYLKTARKNLKEDGLFLLHSIVSPQTEGISDPWMGKYIFPNGYVPSFKQITSAAEGLFMVEDLHNIGAYYDPTLMAWWENFDKAWPKLKKDYDDTFYRMWRFYLLCCAGSFRSRGNGVAQFILSPHGVAGGYDSVR
jgi:cyclopropane-fatty-acyl-phospholipid synthase